jgi:hypothetical protein
MASNTSRNLAVSVRLSVDEIDYIKQQADASGMKVSDYIRYRVLSPAPVAFVQLANITEGLDQLQVAIARAQNELAGGN